MSSRTLDYPWLFINSEMLQYARTLAASKLKGDPERLARAVFDLTSSRFESPKYSVRFFKTYMPSPAYRIWQKGGGIGSLKQSIVVKAMLLATGAFRDRDAVIMRSEPPYYSPGGKGHYFLRVRAGKAKVYQDSWGRNWKIPYGEHFGWGKTEFTMVPKVQGRWDEMHASGTVKMYLRL